MESNQKIKLHFERFEFKYLMDEMKAGRVLNSLLANNLEWDPYAAGKENHAYTVTSLYYDSLLLKCYQDKIAGLDKRFKLRERNYSENFLNDTPTFYEIKKKKDAVVIKDRQIGSPGSGFEFLRARHGLEPLLLVRYKRQALQGKFQERLRVTFDRELTAVAAKSFKEYDLSRQVAPGLVIMEVKYNNTLPGWFSRTIQEYELDRRPFSKYCAGIETCGELLLRARLGRSVDQTVVPRNYANLSL